jgi:hypothetical protein
MFLFCLTILQCYNLHNENVDVYQSVDKFELCYKIYPNIHKFTMPRQVHIVT